MSYVGNSKVGVLDEPGRANRFLVIETEDEYDISSHGYQESYPPYNLITRVVTMNIKVPSVQGYTGSYYLTFMKYIYQVYTSCR